MPPLWTPTAKPLPNAKGPDFAWTQVSRGAKTHKQTGTKSTQHAIASWGDIPANAHLPRDTPKSQGSLLAPAQTLWHKLGKMGQWNIRYKRSLGPGHTQTGITAMQPCHVNASWGDTPANAHFSQEPRLPTGPALLGHWN